MSEKIKVGERAKCQDCPTEIVRNNSTHTRCDECAKERERARKRSAYRSDIERQREIARTKAKKRYHTNTERMRKAIAQWRAANPDKVAQMWKRIKERRRTDVGYKTLRNDIREQRKDHVNAARRKRRNESEPLRERENQRSREKGAQYREELSPTYVRGILAQTAKMRRSEISPDIIELKTLQLRLVRGAREGLKAENENHA